MSTNLYGTAFTLMSQQLANSFTTYPVVKNEAFDYYGRVRRLGFTYVTTGLETSGSVIALVELPPRSKVIGGLLATYQQGTNTPGVGTPAGLGTSVTVSIGLLLGAAGTGGSGTEFANALTALAAGSKVTFADSGGTPGANAVGGYGTLIASPSAAATAQANIQNPLGDLLILTTGGATLAGPGNSAGTAVTLDGQVLVVVD